MSDFFFVGIQRELASTKKLVENFDLKLKEKDSEIFQMKKCQSELQTKFDGFFFIC